MKNLNFYQYIGLGTCNNFFSVLRSREFNVLRNFYDSIKHLRDSNFSTIRTCITLMWHIMILLHHIFECKRYNRFVYLYCWFRKVVQVFLTGGHISRHYYESVAVSLAQRRFLITSSNTSFYFIICFLINYATSLISSSRSKYV